MSNQIDFYINKKILNAWKKNKRYTVAYSGRGVGKSLQFAALCVIYAIQNPRSRILAIRGTQNKISESSLQIIKDVIKMMHLDSYFNITEHTLSCKNGSEFLFYGAQNYQSFKSLQGINLVFVDEATEVSENAWQVLIPTIRELGSKFLISFNPYKEDDWVYKTFITSTHPDAAVVKLTIDDNPFFPEELRKELEYDKAFDYDKYKHVWLGEIKQNIEGALFKPDWIKHKEIDFKQLVQIVIAVDPSTTSNKNSDECGMVVAGKIGKEYYILEDASGVMSPSEWVSKSIILYHNYKANKIIYESNQGGDMVKTMIRQIDPTVAISDVRATRGKYLRAEPVASLYEQNLVYHTKRLPKLEYQLTSFTGKDGEKDDRVDALVYSLTSFLKTKINPPTTPLRF